MSNPRLESVVCASLAGMHRMAYWEWGDPANTDVVLCVHGLTRTGRDFDALARALSNDFRVVCPDIAGRGESDWLANPVFYSVPQYVADLTTLFARIRPRRLAWVGTSMGGLIGMAFAGALAAARRTPGKGPGAAAKAAALPALSGMVLNDVGPHVGVAGLMRIASYVGRRKVFASFEDAVAEMKAVAAPYGPHTDAQWRELARHAYVQHEGAWVPNYDPGIAMGLAPPDGMSQAAAEQMLWQCYETLDGPVLILRGAQSDILVPATVEGMLAARQDARLVEFEGVGHAPSLLQEDQIAAVAAFLRQAVLKWPS
ncbi:alpha/beta fold hydrolase [Kerstersia gyiorum]|uniref:alpha/beta fold hydrolase n=1 Tax=Kerstersia gyiorum TaxID=206506 RepID=UPI003B42D27A